MKTINEESVENLDVTEPTTAKNLKEVRGDLTVSANFDAPNLDEVGGYLTVYDGAVLDVPLLAKVGMSLVVHAFLVAPDLAEVGGDLFVNDDPKAPNLKEKK